MLHNIIFGFLIPYGLTTIAVFLGIYTAYFIFAKIKDKQFKKNESRSEKFNKILSEILHLSLDDGSLSENAYEIINILKTHYNINFCTLFLFNKRKLYPLATNIISKEFLDDVVDYANTKFKGMQDWSAMIEYADDTLAYSSAIERGVKYQYFSPLVKGDKLIGAIMIENKNLDMLETTEIELCDLLMDNITVAVNSLIKNDTIKANSLTDALTGIYNVRCMHVQIGEQIKLHSRTYAPFTFVLLDIDHFKKVNDTYGHAMGDKVLIQISNFIKDQIRENVDVIYRYGGEEFVIMFPHTKNKDIYNRLDEIRRLISDCVVTSDDGKTSCKVNVSFGLSQYPSDGESIEALYQCSDKALYYAKEHGRNQVVIYSDKKDEIAEIEKTKKA